MKRYSISIILLAVVINVFGQVKYDRNWVFGNNAGIDFTDASNPVTFSQPINNLRLSASFSNVVGELLVYISCPLSGYENCGINNQLGSIVNGDSIRTYPTNGTGTTFIPIINDSLIGIHLFHIGHYDRTNCIFPNDGCVRLYNSVITLGDSGFLSVSLKNQLLLNVPVENRLAAVEHSNGIDWWLIAHELGNTSIGYPCTDLFIKYLVTADSIKGPYYQNIGTLHCDGLSAFGEMVFSNDGRYLASSLYGDKKIDLFSFDRCTGQLYDFKLVEDGNGNYHPHGCAFSGSGRVIYSTSSLDGTSNKRLYQYDLDTMDIPSTRTIIWSGDTINQLFFGSLELGQDNRIYLASQYQSGVPNNIFNQYNQNLSVIHQPDSAGLACDFRPFSFYLGDSSRSYIGLPNMPNYNLGPAGAYALPNLPQDTLTLCSDTGTASLQIGMPALPNIVYHWSPADGLDDTTLAQPTTTVGKDLWYYVTMTDTTTGASCNTKVDSVHVQVRQCIDNIHSPHTSKPDYILHSNLLKDEMSARVVLGTEEEGQVQIFGINGQHIRSYTLGEGVNDLPIGKLGLSGGIYFFQIWVNDELKNTDKLIIVR